MTRLLRLRCANGWRWLQGTGGDAQVASVETSMRAKRMNGESKNGTTIKRENADTPTHPQHTGKRRSLRICFYSGFYVLFSFVLRCLLVFQVFGRGRGIVGRGERLRMFGIFVDVLSWCWCLFFNYYYGCEFRGWVSWYFFSLVIYLLSCFISIFY